MSSGAGGREEGAGGEAHGHWQVEIKTPFDFFSITGEREAARLCFVFFFLISYGQWEMK